MQRVNLTVTRWLMIMVAVLELAFSQIHIRAITAMFTRELGFYLFLFILFGLLLIFLLLSMKALDAGSVFRILLPGLIASASAGYCIRLMWKDYMANEVIILNDFRLSVILLAAAMGVYLSGSVVILINSLVRGREA